MRGMPRHEVIHLMNHQTRGSLLIGPFGEDTETRLEVESRTTDDISTRKRTSIVASSARGLQNRSNGETPYPCIDSTP